MPEIIADVTREVGSCEPCHPCTVDADDLKHKTRTILQNSPKNVNTIFFKNILIAFD